MISPFIIKDKNLFLSRFPVAQVNRSLQAWDAADEYIINYLNEQQLITNDTKLAIFNDSFGALGCNFSANEGFNGQVYSVSDSYISQQGMLNNLAQNNLDASNITPLDSLASLPENIDVILYKIPKSKSLLTEQLIQIKNSVKNDTLFIAADRAKEIHSSTLKIFEKYLGTTTTSLAVKKARLVFCQLDNKVQQQSPFPTVWDISNPYQDSDAKFTISNQANVYSREKLDIGARYFIENLPKVAQNSQVIDLGCGNGVIGLHILAQQPLAHVRFFDESHMAINSAQTNITHNLPQLVEQCQFQLNDCLADVESNSADLILCNPPFHQQTATTDHIAWQMFNDSYRVLKKGGELRIIGNRQLGYHIKLKRIFGNVKLIASNDKFVTQSSIKR